MQFYIQLFGSGMNFFVGPGESHHKTFVKVPGQQTQRRVGEFAVQVADRVYEDLVYTTVQTFNKEASDIYESPCAQNNITGMMMRMQILICQGNIHYVSTVKMIILFFG